MPRGPPNPSLGGLGRGAAVAQDAGARGLRLSSTPSLLLAPARLVQATQQ